MRILAYSEVVILLRRRYRPRRSGFRRRRLFVLLIFLFGITFWFAESRLPAVKEDLQQSALRRFAVERIAETVESALPETVCLEDGATLELDTYTLSTMQSTLTKKLDNALSGTAIEWVPVGNLSGISLLNGHGFKIPVFFSVNGVAMVRFDNGFDSAGINRTRYTITMTVTAELYSASVTFPETVTVTTSYPIYESVTQGEVPRYAAGVLS